MRNSLQHSVTSFLRHCSAIRPIPLSDKNSFIIYKLGSDFVSRIICFQRMNKWLHLSFLVRLNYTSVPERRFILYNQHKTIHVFCCQSLNTLRPRQHGRHFADDTFRRISRNENVWISIEISLKFVRKGSINNIPALVMIMTWRRPGGKPLSGPMMVRLPTHICVARPQWANIG